MSSYFTDGSRQTLTEPVSNRYSFTSPSHRSMYRSIKGRKNRQRIPGIPGMSDPDLYPQFRMSGSYEPRTASLDRHNFGISAGELFEQSKLIRVNSSMTSLSTPSFRLRPEAETKGPCLMGLALPSEFDAIFMVESVRTNVNLISGSVVGGIDEKAASAGSKKILLDDIESVPSLENVNVAHSFDYHTVNTCLGCMNLKPEEDMTPATVNNNQEGDESLSSRTKSTLGVIAECVEGSSGENRVSPRTPRILTPVRPGAAPGVNGQSPSHQQAKSQDDGAKVSPGLVVSIAGEKHDEQSLLRKEVLKHVSNMICGVGSKNNEQSLLRYYYNNNISKIVCCLKKCFYSFQTEAKVSSSL